MHSVPDATSTASRCGCNRASAMVAGYPQHRDVEIADTDFSYTYLPAFNN